MEFFFLGCLRLLVVWSGSIVRSVKLDSWSIKWGVLGSVVSDCGSSGSGGDKSGGKERLCVHGYLLLGALSLLVN